jgi:ligand-binding sensor domain-containing protein/class 3 adenylate cyclase
MANTLKKYHLLLLFIFCWSCHFLFAQNIYNFKNFTISEGLSQSSALCFLQDENYGLWIGTQDGLNRFDGKKFDVYTTENTSGLQGNYIHEMLSDTKGDLWIATGNGLVHRNKKTEEFTTYNNGGDLFSIESIALDKDKKNIWIATSRKGVWAFDIKNKTFSQKSTIFTTKQARKVFVTAEGLIFVASDDNLLEAYNPRTNQLKKIAFNNQLKNFAINSFYQKNQQEIIVCTNQGIYTCFVSTFQTTPIFEQVKKEFGSLNSTGILQTADNHWYITTTNNGLITILPNGDIINSTEDIFQKNALVYNNINTIYEDKNNTIWIGTSRGISGFDPISQGFLGISVSGDTKHGLTSPNVWCIEEKPASTILFIGTDSGISKYDTHKREFTHYSRANKKDLHLENSEKTVLDIQFINDQFLLAACTDGVFELHIGNNGTYQFNPIPFIDKTIKSQFNTTYKIVEYQPNRYFFATRSGALLVDYTSKTAKEFTNDSKNPVNSILPGICRLVFKDSQKRIFFATSSGGLSVLDDSDPKNLIIKPYTYNNVLNKNLSAYISSVVEISKNTFYFGTAGDGIVYWNENNKKVAIYNKNNGLPNNVVYAIIPDNQKNLWISTNKGLCRFELATKTAYNFTELHGLLSNEFNMGAGLRANSGTIYFGGISGLVFFNPTTLSNYNLKLDVTLTNFKIENEWIHPTSKNSPLSISIPYEKTIQLSYKQRSFTIRFQTDNLSATELINYKYHLESRSEEGKDIEIGNSNEIQFNSLSPGHYTLKIYARIGYGDWISKPKIITIIIQPPFWNTWWFWVICSIALILIIRFSITKRIQAERRQQVRLEMKIAERTAEIREQNKKIEQQNNELEKQRQQLEVEKEKSDRLLRNVIPDSMADELLTKGFASARAFKVVSVMFTDFVGFTKITDSMSPTELVKKLDVFFRKFDEIIFDNNLERIKTIGDAYMAAGGVPVRNSTNPIDICLAGLQIQHYVKELEKEAIDANQMPWRLRIGINTGEVTAGVIGTKRLAYDVWGATVNYAQRMEMFGEAGKVSITRNTYLHIKPYFECTYKGLISAKGEEKVQMYTLDRIKPELSVDGKGVLPNDRFHKIVNLHHYSSINYYKAERFIMKKLEAELSSKLHYHSIEHTLDVVKAVERIALSENVTDEGLFLLKTAASYHDAGFVEQYDKNEPVGVRMANEILPKYGYTPEHIEIIKKLIFVTSVPHQPTNLLEEIICDADLDYLGRDDFHQIADKLRLELREHGKINSDRAWDEIQVRFLEQHCYFTQTSLKTRLPKKLQNLEEIKERLKRNEYKD